MFLTHRFMFLLWIPSQLFFLAGRGEISNFCWVWSDRGIYLFTIFVVSYLEEAYTYVILTTYSPIFLSLREEVYYNTSFESGWSE